MSCRATSASRGKLLEVFTNLPSGFACRQSVDAARAAYVQVLAKVLCKRALMLNFEGLLMACSSTSPCRHASAKRAAASALSALYISTCVVRAAETASALLLQVAEQA